MKVGRDRHILSAPASLSGWRYMLGMMLMAAVLSTHGSQSSPNFLVIVADDMGWSDISAFGSEIRTPTLDALASQGVTMTNFHVSPTCSPTRAMLMSGVDSHLAGLGTMAGVQAPNQLNSENYAGQLNDDVVTLAEGLKAAGYTTLMSGKWHLAKEANQYPNARGFDQSYFLLEGGASHYSDGAALYPGAGPNYMENGQPATLPEDFYSSKYYTDKIIEYIRQVDGKRPFFAYLAYTAPHDPLHVPEPWRAKYSGVYSAGPDSIRRQRLAELTNRGLIPDGIETWGAPKFPKFIPAHIPPWGSLTDQEREKAARPMEIYAGMIEFMDDQISRLIDFLRESGELENTYIVFLSDNGPNAATPLSYPNMSRDYYRSRFIEPGAQEGEPGSHPYLGREWAWASATPFKLYKGAISEGGVRSPLIVVGPKVAKGRRSAQLAHVTDLPATVYELAGIDPQGSEVFRGKHKPSGVSLIENWTDPTAAHSRQFAIELFGHQAAIAGDWKITRLMPPVGSGKWELYNLQLDPGEMNNLAEEQPEKLDEMIVQYLDYKEQVGVIPPRPPISVSLGDLFTGECSPVCKATVSIIDFIMAIWVKTSVSS